MGGDSEDSGVGRRRESWLGEGREFWACRVWGTWDSRGQQGDLLGLGLVSPRGCWLGSWYPGCGLPDWAGGHCSGRGPGGGDPEGVGLRQPHSFPGCEGPAGGGDGEAPHQAPCPKTDPVAPRGNTPGTSPRVWLGWAKTDRAAVGGGGPGGKTPRGAGRAQGRMSRGLAPPGTSGPGSAEWPWVRGALHSRPGAWDDDSLPTPRGHRSLCVAASVPPADSLPGPQPRVIPSGTALGRPLGAGPPVAPQGEAVRGSGSACLSLPRPRVCRGGWGAPSRAGPRVNPPPLLEKSEELPRISKPPRRVRDRHTHAWPFTHPAQPISTGRQSPHPQRGLPASVFPLGQAPPHPPPAFSSPRCRGWEEGGRALPPPRAPILCPIILSGLGEGGREQVRWGADRREPPGWHSHCQGIRGRFLPRPAAERWEGTLGRPTQGSPEPLQPPPPRSVPTEAPSGTVAPRQPALLSGDRPPAPPCGCGRSRGAEGHTLRHLGGSLRAATRPPRSARSRESSSALPARYSPKNTPSFRNCGSGAGSGLRGGEAGGEATRWGRGAGGRLALRPGPGPDGAQGPGTCGGLQKCLAALPPASRPGLPSRERALSSPASSQTPRGACSLRAGPSAGARASNSDTQRSLRRAQRSPGCGGPQGRGALEATPPSLVDLMGGEGRPWG